jgi:hypothetical protein
MKQQSITSLPLSPEMERRNRMIKYSVTMGIRVVCIVMMLFVQGWWLLVFALGAILLPYIAVVIANVHADPRGAEVYRPGAIELVGRDAAPGASATPGPAPAAETDGTDEADEADEAAGTDETTQPAPADRRDADGSAA